MTDQPDADAIVAALDAHAEKLGVVVLQPWYVSGTLRTPTDYSDESMLYCEPCGKALLERARPHLHDGQEHDLTTADCPTEEDCCHCRTCGTLLEYGLSDDGAMSELRHFEDNPPKTPLSADEAHHIARMVEGAPGDESVLEIGRRTLEMIPVG